MPQQSVGHVLNVVSNTPSIMPQKRLKVLSSLGLMFHTKMLLEVLWVAKRYDPSVLLVQKIRENRA